MSIPESYDRFLSIAIVAIKSVCWGLAIFVAPFLAYWVIAWFNRPREKGEQIR